MREQECWIPDEAISMLVRCIQGTGFISGDGFCPEVLTGEEFLDLAVSNFATHLGRVRFPLLSRREINHKLTARLLFACSPKRFSVGEMKNAMLLDCLNDARMQLLLDRDWFDSVAAIYPLIDIRKNLKVTRVIQINPGITRSKILECM
jgi:hypothetical protein